MLCALAGLAITPGRGPGVVETIVLAVAVFLSAASAGAFNQYFERDLDAEMARTRNRPFVTGVFRADWQWLTAIGVLLLAAVGSAAWVLNSQVAFFVFLGAFFYGIVYTVWLKRRSVWNIVIGGLAGSFAVLAGGAAVEPGLSANTVILAVVLFLWTPPHFWSLATALHKDYAKAGVPMLPVVMGDAAAARIILAHTLVLVGLSLVPGFLGLGWIYLAAAAAGGALFIYRSIQLVDRPGPKAAIANFHASLIQLTVLLIAAIVAPGL